MKNMTRQHVFCVLIALLYPLVSVSRVTAQLSRRDWGAPSVLVAHEEGRWTISGARTKVAVRERDLTITIEAGSATWSMLPSSAQDVIVRARGRDVALRLADAPQIVFRPFDTGFKTGIEATLSGWPETDLTLFLTIALEEGVESISRNKERQEELVQPDPR